MKTKIEWTDETWNPVTGCTKVSPGCEHCYAERIAERFRGVPGHPYENGFDLQLRPERLSEPSRWRKPRVVFVCSMADLFHQDVPDHYLTEVFVTMQKNRKHIFQVLTKRPHRMLKFLKDEWPWTVPENVWLGVSMEGSGYLWRADVLRLIPASIRFLSIEPLLSKIDDLDLKGIHWVIVGGESGPDARYMDATWPRAIRDQCAEAGVPFFFKQWGAYNEEGFRVGKKAASNVLDGRQHLAVPSVDSVAIWPRLRPDLPRPNIHD